MKMKKTLLSLAAAVLMIAAAQPAQAQVDFGIVAGLNVTKARFHNVGDNISSSNRCGWYVGPKIVVTLPIVGLGIDASVQYSQRRINGGYEDALVYYDDGSACYKSIEIPINVRYGFGLPSLVYAFAFTGPQFGFTVDGKNWDWNDTHYKFKNSYLTWNAGVGVRVLSHFELTAGYNFALNRMAHRYIDDDIRSGSFKGNSWQIQVAYFF